MIGSQLGSATVLFLGWFGPRGIASILYVLLLLEGSSVPGRDEILSVVMTTIFLSIFAHRLTAVPGSNWYAQYKQQTDSDAAEHEKVGEMPVRLGMHLNPGSAK
jgi:NhaP-type Na+/H+ or K+/H+ antiporter